jgi:Tol biopolymer transport system component
MLALVAACLALPASLAPSAEAAFPGANGKIAFIGMFTPAGSFSPEIYVMDADGSNRVRLTTDIADEFDPTWSADGRKIAFSRAAGNPDGNVDIYVMDADGSNQQRLTENPLTDSQPAWSPDGTKIAFRSQLPDGNSEIYVMDADGSNQQRLTENPRSDSQPAWSPDGTKIAFGSEGPDNNSQISVMDADGSNQEPLTATSINFRPNWSPDGTKIVFSSFRDDPEGNSGGNSEIYVMNADGSNEVRLTRNERLDDDAAWSPDGTKITFMSFRDVAIEIYVMDADGSNQVPLTQVSDSRQPDWQPLPADTDGDALLDSWETDGLDVDADGTIDLDLPAMGADPMHKDIFLEIDHMTGHALSQAAVEKVEAAFAAAPVSNPDDGSGVTLHVDNGSTSTMNPLTGESWGALSDANTLAHEMVLGAFAAPGVYDWSAFDALKAANFSDARKRAFHYVVSGHQYGAASNTSSGISRNSPGLSFASGASDLLVTLGAFQPGEGSGTVDEQAGTLMHEFGHNLGLRHGGSDHTNYKPSYLSIMNYSFQMTGLRRADGTFLLDYSQLPLSLNENALDEDNGFGFAPGSAEAQFVTLALCPGNLPPSGGGPDPGRIPLLAGPVDWDCDGTEQGVVAADVNADGQLSAFTPFLDWPALVYGGGAIGDAGGSIVLPQTTEVIEPQLEELRANQQALQGALDTTAPELKVPADLTVDATSPNGATVSYSASATDDVDPTPTVECSPASGSVFPIGTTVVSCTATDDAGNSASGTFNVTVRGAAEQIVRLIDKTLEFLGLPTLEAALKARLQTAANALIAKNKTLACSALKLYIAAVKVLPPRLLTAAQKDELVGDANRIRAVIGCP